MDWFNLLKAKGDGKLNFIVRWGLTDEFASVEQILFRMKESGKHLIIKKVGLILELHIHLD